MDLSQRERLSELVEELTTSGQPHLDQQKMKEVKKICKVSNDCIDHVYHSVMTQLNQEHAEIRLSAFQITSELFSRSHHFRTLLVDNFQDFMELTTEIDPEQPLPPPKPVAKKLRSLAIQTIQSWQTSFGQAYKKLALGYHFLKQVKKVDFQDAEARTVTARRMEEDRRRRKERIYKEKVEAAATEMEESYQDIEMAITEMESCLKLLFPEFDLTDSQARQPDDEEPCCSKDLKDQESRTQRKENTANGAKKGKARKEKEDGNDPQENKEEMEECQRDEREEEEEEEEEEVQSCEAETAEETHEEFIRSSGLISHSYSLDLKLDCGEYEQAQYVVLPPLLLTLHVHDMFPSSGGFTYRHHGLPRVPLQHVGGTWRDMIRSVPKK